MIRLIFKEHQFVGPGPSLPLPSLAALDQDLFVASHQSRVDLGLDLLLQAVHPTAAAGLLVSGMASSKVREAMVPGRVE